MKNLLIDEKLLENFFQKDLPSKTVQSSISLCYPYSEHHYGQSLCFMSEDGG